MGCVAIIDDEPFMLRLAARMLSGHRVLPFVDPADALGFFPGDPPVDVVVCEARLHRGSSIRFYAELEHRWPQLASRTVLTTTGLLEPAEQRFVAGFGGTVLRKPFAVGQLREVVDHLVRGGDQRSFVPRYDPSA